MIIVVCIFFFKQKTAYEMRISDWSSDVCSSDLPDAPQQPSGVRADPPGEPAVADVGPVRRAQRQLRPAGRHAAGREAARALRPMANRPVVRAEGRRLAAHPRYPSTAELTQRHHPTVSDPGSRTHTDRKHK